VETDTLIADVDPDVIINLRQQVAMQRRINGALKADAHSFYVPHAKQHTFHSSSHKRRAMFTGNRFGKSQSGCVEDIAWLRGERTWYKRSFDIKDGTGAVVAQHEGGEHHPLVRSGIPQRPTKGLVITTDWDKVDEIWTSERGERTGKLWKYIPQGFVIGRKRNHSGAVDTVECANGSLLRFDTVKSFMANPQGSESSDWDFIHIDEPCPEAMFKGAARGLVDRHGSAWFTLTALTEPWIVDMFHQNGFGTPLKEGFYSVIGSIYDNPYLPREAIAEFEALLTEDEKQCRLYGIPLHLAGLVHKPFRYDVHVLREPPKGWLTMDSPPKEYTIHIRIDPHPQTPHAILFCAVAPWGQRYYFKDVFMHGTVPELARVIREVVGERTLGSIKIDPLAYIEDQNNPGTTMAAQFVFEGLPVQKARKDREAGILKVNQELARKPQMIWFGPAAARSLWEIQRYCWDPRGTNKPVDADDHMMENLYRMELDNPWWTDETNYEKPVDDMVFSELDLSPVEIGDLV